jgi:1-acyl-sn-glycerol-3-phosphate acyltransferase
MRLIYTVRSAIGGVLFLLMTLFCSVIAIIEVSIWNNRHFENFIVSFWGKCSIWLFGTRVIQLQRENLPKGACLLVFNHTSFFDVFALLGYVPSVRFGAKIELFKIPFFGRAMLGLGILPIARENRTQVFKVYEKAIEKTLLGQKYALAPEGTRNSSESLRPFKTGPFVFALQAQIPIVPVIVKGAFDCMHKGDIIPNKDRWRRDITLKYLPPIPTAGLGIDSKDKLKSQVFDLMQTHF